MVEGEHDGLLVCNVAQHMGQPSLERVHLAVLPHAALGEDVEPVTMVAQLFGHSRQDGLLSSSAADDGQRFAGEEELAQQLVCVAHVIGAQRPPHAAVARLREEQAGGQHGTQQCWVVQGARVVAHRHQRPPSRP
jgi:hypothetical protein